MPYRIDNYTVFGTLGEGNFGKVKFATDAAGREVALKVFDTSTPEGHERAIRNLRSEVEGYRNLNHPNIVAFLHS